MTRHSAPHRIAIVGTGLIGASLGLALRRAFGRGLQVVGWDRSSRALTEAIRMKALTATAKSLADAVGDSDVVIIAAPLSAVTSLLTKTIAVAKPGALVLDVAGVKRPVIAAVRPLLRRRKDVAFVSTHPLAGREHAGARFARADMFARRPFAIIRELARPAALARAESLVRRIGAKPVRLSAAEHDRIVAATSALPQLVAVALALAADEPATRRTPLAGPGLAGATRLAASPYSVWAGAITANQRSIMRALRRVRAQLDAVERAARQGDDRPMERLFRRAAAARRRVVRE